MARKYKQRKVTKKDWVKEELDKYYSSKGIASSIRNTPVDWKRYNPSINPTEIYDKYNIRQFTSKEQFRQYYIEKGLVDDRVDLKERERLLTKMWNDYVKREQLIMTGQYEELRAEIFKKNYIKALTAIGAPQDLISQLEKATLEQWNKMSSLPNFDKDSTEDKKLPHLGGFAYSTKGDNERSYDMEKMLPDIIDAARQAGIIIDDTQDLMRNQQIITLRRVTRLIPREVQESLSELPTSQDVRESTLSALSPLTKSGRKRFRISRAGNLYIPFVGSQGSRSEETRQLIADIQTEFERRGLSLSDFIEGWNKR